MYCLIDGDIILYRSAFATEYKTYTHPVLGTFRRKKELDGFLKFNVDEDTDEYEAEIQINTKLEPLTIALKILEGTLEEIRRNTGATKQLVYIAGDGENFRKKVEYPVAYKGNRQPKPVHYKALHEYLKGYKGSTYKVIPVDGIEVDDAIGIAQSQSKFGKTIICSIDKDLRMIPGLHYDIVTKEVENISELEANRNFYKQMLTGDRVDNVRGIYGIGPKHASALIDDELYTADMDAIVRLEYREHFKEDWKKMYEANKKLLWILREPLKNEDLVS